MTKSGFDLDEIERLLAAATPGEWDTEFDPIDAGDHATAVCLPGKAGSLGTFLAYCQHNWGEAVYNERRISWKEATSNAALIVALHNSAAAMIAEIRELRAENARLRVECEFIASATASPLVNPLETGFRHSPLSPRERETRYMEACALAYQSACVALTGEPQ